jgi:gamma-glutamyltranspeptidase / glutathione hydrolase
VGSTLEWWHGVLSRYRHLDERVYPETMKGAIAAGHPLSTDVGARVLADGGNAIDACIAATFAAFVAEGPLTGPAGGGFLLAHVDGKPVLLDCFFAVPSRSLGEMEEIVVDFGDSSTQVFHVGEASAAVPGLVLGLEEAHRRFGTRPWHELVEPAIGLANAGVDVIEPQAVLHVILAGVLLRNDAGRRIYGNPDRCETQELAPTLEAIRDRGAAAVADLVPELADELAAYRVEEREPIQAALPEHELLTTPPPSRGGAIVAAALARLAEAHTLDQRAHALLDAYAASPPARMRGTTHVSVIDGNGDAAALSSTLGAGAGVFRGGAQLNNMLGERDVIGDAAPEPGARLASMMTPTLVVEAGRPRLAVGSAGSVRLAAAIAQVTDAALNGVPLEQAIEAPRLHVDADGVLHLEGGFPGVAPDGWPVVRWAGRNLFFGGVSAVEREPDGTYSAAGDPRRGGCGIVVP